jgi:hypothetical protein
MRRSICELIYRVHKANVPIILVVVVTIRLFSSILVEHLISRKIPVVMKSVTRLREMHSDEQEHKRSAHRAVLKDETCNVYFSDVTLACYIDIFLTR